MRITVLTRGGLSVYGPGSYDAKNNTALLAALDGESVAVRIEYPAAPTDIATESEGIEVDDIDTSGNVVTLSLIEIQASGRVAVSATVAGERRVVNIATQAGGPVQGAIASAEVPDFVQIFEDAQLT